MYKNWKILKSELSEKQKEYSQVAEWCDESQEYTIEEQGEYYAVVKIPEPSVEQVKSVKIAEYKQYLADTDYVIIKIAEGVATSEEYAEIIAQRQEAREQIRKLM